MAFVQVKNTLQTLKIAAFIVAFFSSFFSHSLEIDYGKLNGVAPDTDSQCVVTDAAPVISGLIGGDCDIDVEAICVSLYPPQEQNGGADYRTNTSGELREQTETFAKVYCTWTNNTFIVGIGWTTLANELYVGNVGLGTELVKSCPPASHPYHTTGHDFNDDGEIDTCYHPNDIQAQLAEQNELDKNEDYCKGLVLDSGNNVSSTACYSAYNGASCSVSQVTVGDATYYKGTGNEVLGCGSSEDPPFDSSGTGDDKDGCLFSGGTNYCEANRDKHCSSISGTEICDDGCIDDGANLYCDVAKHPDVGEGESDYFADNGTCSVIAASSSKGFCEEMGGTWDETAEYQETSCPVGTGSCSVPTAGHCSACFDAGGTWTPDDVSTQTQETKAAVEIAALVKTGNEKLTQIEAGQRKTTEALISTTKSGNGKIVSALENLTKIVKDKPSGGGAAQEEREIYTTTTSAIDKTAFNAVFDVASTAALKVANTAKELEIKNLKNSIIAEGKALFTISATGSGYEARNLTMSQGTFDLSLSRFSFFFALLAAPIMLIATVYAGLIILGGKR